MKRVSNYDARGLISRRADFESHTGNFWGESHEPGRYVYTGHLPGRLKGTDTVSDADYIVYSYATPIAWHLPDGWVIPPVTYSVSTTRHQSIARYAIGGAWYSEHHLPDRYDLSPRAREILSAIRYGRAVTRQAREHRAPFDAVVATGEAVWLDADSVGPVEGVRTEVRR